MYIGLSLAILTDLTPAEIVVPSTAVFMFAVNIVSGNAPLIVPLLQSYFSSREEDYTFIFTAAPMQGSAAAAAGLSSVTFSTAQTGANPLQRSMLWAIGGLYVLSGLLYVLCSAEVFRMRSARLR